MGSPYRQITLDDARPGMVLSDDVLDLQGHVLLTKGMALTEPILASLRRHGVALVPVLAEDAPESAKESEIVHHEARLARLFRKRSIGSGDATALLEQCVRHFRLGDAA